MVDEDAGGIKDYSFLLADALKKQNILVSSDMLNSDIIHYQLGGGSWRVGLNILINKPEIPTVITIHDVLQRRAIVKNIYPFLFKRILNNSDAIILHTNHAFDLLKKKYGNIFCNKTSIIPHGCKSIEIDRRTARRLLNLSEEDIVFITGGLLIPRKGVHKIIKAFLNIESSINKLIIFGTGPKNYVKYLKNLASDDSRIKFLGYIDEGKMDLLYGACNAVLCYKSDSLGETSGILCRAIGARRIIIANEIGEHYEILGDNGIITPNDSIHLLYKAMMRINDDFYSEEKKHGLDKLANNNSWDKIAKEHICLYEQIIKLIHTK